MDTLNIPDLNTSSTMPYSPSWGKKHGNIISHRHANKCTYNFRKNIQETTADQTQSVLVLLPCVKRWWRWLCSMALRVITTFSFFIVIIKLAPAFKLIQGQGTFSVECFIIITAITIISEGSSDQRKLNFEKSSSLFAFEYVYKFVKQKKSEFYVAFTFN